MMKKTLFTLTLLSTSLSVCAAKAVMPAGYTPAVDNTQISQKVSTRFVPVAMPGQLMPINRLPHRLTGLSAVKAANKKAEKTPLSSRFIDAIMVYDYMSGALYQIYCAPLSVTDLQFQSNEHIISVAAGDTLRWQVSRTFSGSGLERYEHLMIKPIDSGLTNSLVVTTDLRTYHLELHSTDSAYMASVQWRYPQGQGFVKTYGKTSASVNTFLASRALSLGKLDFNYEANLISGDTPAWMPLMVFNDGSKTYVQFPPQMQISPTLFVGSDPSHATVVNYREEGNYYIIDQVAKSLILRVGQTDPTVVQIVYGKS